MYNERIVYTQTALRVREGEAASLQLTEKI